MRSARQQLISSGQHTGKARFQPWRDGIVDRLDAKLAERRGEKDQKLLTKVEQASLTSQGFSIDAAKQQAEQMAQALVSFANQTRNSDDVTLPDTKRESVELKRAKFKSMMAEARSGKFSKNESLSQRATQKLAESFVWRQVSLRAGSILLIGSILWAKQNGMFEPEMIESLRSTATSVNDSLAGSMSGGAASSDSPLPIDSNQVSSALQQLGSSSVMTKETRPFLGVFTNLGQGLIGFIILVMSLMAGLESQHCDYDRGRLGIVRSASPSSVAVLTCTRGCIRSEPRCVDRGWLSFAYQRNLRLIAPAENDSRRIGIDCERAVACKRRCTSLPVSVARRHVVCQRDRDVAGATFADQSPSTGHSRRTVLCRSRAHAATRRRAAHLLTFPRVTAIRFLRMPIAA